MVKHVPFNVLIALIVLLHKYPFLRVRSLLLWRVDDMNSLSFSSNSPALTSASPDYHTTVPLLPSLPVTGPPTPVWAGSYGHRLRPNPNLFRRKKNQLEQTLDNSRTLTLSAEKPPPRCCLAKSLSFFLQKIGLGPLSELSIAACIQPEMCSSVEGSLLKSVVA